jgi:hypothetical protein
MKCHKLRHNRFFTMSSIDLATEQGKQLLYSRYFTVNYCKDALLPIELEQALDEHSKDNLLMLVTLQTCSTIFLCVSYSYRTKGSKA